uniref:Uncharacterized protein n=1 Tax=Nelumbo nucifera TaxID=4432 RepID=A0A822Z2K3_NELNU|nr:TPA_asm: hypothetical protein HUJ06_014967 [Nelumbo nucifera]
MEPNPIKWTLQIKSTELVFSGLIS